MEKLRGIMNPIIIGIADVIVPEGGHNKIAIDMIISRLKQIIIEKKEFTND